MSSLREFSSAIMQKHLLRAKLRQLVNKARVYGRTPENVGEIKKGWGAYDAMKARAFAAQVAALRELAARSARVVELARGDYVIKHMKLNPGAWRGATDTKRAAQGKFSQRMTEAIQDVLDDKRKLPFSVSNNRGSVAADYAKQARDEMAMSRKEIAWWLRSQREAAQGRSFRPFSDHLYHARERGSRSQMF